MQTTLVLDFLFIQGISNRGRQSRVKQVIFTATSPFHTIMTWTIHGISDEWQFSKVRITAMCSLEREYWLDDLYNLVHVMYSITFILPFPLHQYSIPATLSKLCPTTVRLSWIIGKGKVYIKHKRLRNVKVFQGLPVKGNCKHLTSPRYFRANNFTFDYIYNISIHIDL